jgi:hypothetical protein
MIFSYKKQFAFFPGLNRNGMALDEIDHMFGRYIAITQYGSVLQFNLNMNMIKRCTLTNNCANSNIGGFGFTICSSIRVIYNIDVNELFACMKDPNRFGLQQWYAYQI